MGKLIIIKPIPGLTESLSKVSEFTNFNFVNKQLRKGNKMNKRKLSDRCKDSFQALYSPTVGGLKTGLYKAYDENRTLQEWAEEKWNLPKGYLTNKAWRKNDSRANKDATYFQLQRFRLNDGATFLDLDNLDDFCFYNAALEYKRIANSLKEYKAHKWPKATHYIAVANESEEEKYAKNATKGKAFSYLFHNKFTLPWRRKFLVLMGEVTARSAVSMTEANISNILYNMIDENKSRKGRSDVARFIELSKRFHSTNADVKARLQMEYFLTELVDYMVVLEKADTYTFLKTGLELGNSRQETLDVLLNPKKQSLIEELRKELVLKK